MARASELERDVRVGTVESFKKEEASSRNIYKHNFKPGETFQVAMIKGVTDAHTGEIIRGILPGWQAFQEFTNQVPNIQAFNRIGTYDYDIKITEEENLKNYWTLLIQTTGDLSSTMTAPLIVASGITEQEIRAYCNLPLPEEVAVIATLQQSFNDKYKKVKTNFIEKRTRIYVEYADIAQTKEVVPLSVLQADANAKSNMTSGSLRPDAQKEMERLKDIAYAIKDIIVDYYRATRPDEPRSGKLSDACKSFLSNHQPLDAPHLEGVAYLVEVKINQNSEIVQDAIKRLSYFDLKRMGKPWTSLNSAVQTNNLNRDYNFCWMKIHYPAVSGDNWRAKGESAQAKTITKIDVNDGETNNLSMLGELTEMFTPVLTGTSYMSAVKWELLNILECERLIKKWFEDNEQFFNIVSMETLKKHEKVVAEFAPNVLKTTGFQVDLSGQINSAVPTATAVPTQPAQPIPQAVPPQATPTQSVPVQPIPQQAPQPIPIQPQPVQQQMGYGQPIQQSMQQPIPQPVQQQVGYGQPIQQSMQQPYVQVPVQ